MRNLTDVGLVGVAATMSVFGAVLTTFHPIGGAGYLLCGLALGGLAACVRKLRLAKSIASSASVLRAENDELRETNDDLRRSVTRTEELATELRFQNDRLTATGEQLQTDVTLLRDAIGAVGEQGDDIIKRLRVVWQQYQLANQRHTSLLDAQARLQLVQIMQHFDTDTDMRLNESELEAAKAYLQAAFPNGDVNALVNMAAEGVSLEQLMAATQQH